VTYITITYLPSGTSLNIAIFLSQLQLHTTTPLTHVVTGGEQTLAIQKCTKVDWLMYNLFLAIPRNVYIQG